MDAGCVDPSSFALSGTFGPSLECQQGIRYVKMAGPSTSEADKALARLSVLSQQLAPEEAAITRQPTSSAAQASSSYASIDGRPSSYARVHGEVSRQPAQWRSIPVVARETLTEVLYDKAEGIAKVGKEAGHAVALDYSQVTICPTHPYHPSYRSSA